MCLLTHLTALNLFRKGMSVHSQCLRDVLLEAPMLIQHGFSHFLLSPLIQGRKPGCSYLSWRYGGKNLSLPGECGVCKQEVGLSYHTSDPLSPARLHLFQGSTAFQNSAHSWNQVSKGGPEGGARGCVLSMVLKEALWLSQPHDRATVIG